MLLILFFLPSMMKKGIRVKYVFTNNMMILSALHSSSVQSLVLSPHASTNFILTFKNKIIIIIICFTFCFVFIVFQWSSYRGFNRALTNVNKQNAFFPTVRTLDEKKSLINFCFTGRTRRKTLVADWGNLRLQFSPLLFVGMKK